jgi:hypothetical protein
MQPATQKPKKSRSLAFTPSPFLSCFGVTSLWSPYLDTINRICNKFTASFSKQFKYTISRDILYSIYISDDLLKYSIYLKQQFNSLCLHVFMSSAVNMLFPMRN